MIVSPVPETSSLPRCQRCFAARWRPDADRRVHVCGGCGFEVPWHVLWLPRELLAEALYDGARAGPGVRAEAEPVPE